MFLLMVSMSLLAPAPRAYAFKEPYTGGTDCDACHAVIGTSGQDCVTCHDIAPDYLWYESDNHAGPHGFYTTTSGKCNACHTVHESSATGPLLLQGATVDGTCYTCHDGTGGYGVYGAIAAQGASVGASHRIETTDVVPGGDVANGGSTTMSFNGTSNTLTCTDCHSVHGAQVVDAFTGDRLRLRAKVVSVYSSKLLKQKPGNTTTAVTRYGSDWCLTCHKGRASMGGLINHPVDSTASTYTSGTPFDYGNLAILSSDTTTGMTSLSGLGGLMLPSDPDYGGPHYYHDPGAPYASRNRGFLMPYPRTTQQSGHAPICQQCHEDSRNVGTLIGNGSTAKAAPTVVTADTADGETTSDNPRFQNFPHETQNENMTVETGDDLCLNCHPATQLP